MSLYFPEPVVVVEVGLDDVWLEVRVEVDGVASVVGTRDEVVLPVGLVFEYRVN